MATNNAIDDFTPEIATPKKTGISSVVIAEDETPLFAPISEPSESTKEYWKIYRRPSFSKITSGQLPGRAQPLEVKEWDAPMSLQFFQNAFYVIWYIICKDCMQFLHI